MYTFHLARSEKMVQNEQSGFEVPEDTPEYYIDPAHVNTKLSSSSSEFVYESGSSEESAEISGDLEAAEATLLKFRRHGREAFLSSEETCGWG